MQISILKEMDGRDEEKVREKSRPCAQVRSCPFASLSHTLASENTVSSQPIAAGAESTCVLGRWKGMSPGAPRGGARRQSKTNPV